MITWSDTLGFAGLAAVLATIAAGLAHAAPDPAAAR